MVFLRLHRGNSSERADIDMKFLSLLEEADILTYPPEGGIFRFVTHRDISEEQMKHTLISLPVIAERLE